jgi:hypothetical protein
MTLFDASGHRRSHPQAAMSFHKVLIRKIQRNRSFKIFNLFAECVCQASETAAVHPQRVILLFNVRSGNIIL